MDCSKLKLIAALPLFLVGTQLNAGPDIYLGDVAIPGEDPWQAALVFSDLRSQGAWCGASIIAENVAVTAAHCLFSSNGPVQPGDLRVLEGTSDLGAGGRKLRIERIIIHRNYDDITKDNDIALVFVSGSFQSAAIDGITSNEEAIFAQPGSPARVTGWGRTEYADWSNRLRVGNIAILATAECNREEAYGGIVTQNMLCAGAPFDEQRNIDACSGDSGGPLTIVADGRRVLAGIVSWGDFDRDDGVPPCGDPNLVGVYTRYAKYHSVVSNCLKSGGDLTKECGNSFVLHEPVDQNF